MRLLYIDPGTGSMLFAILIGIIGAAGFLLKNLWVKLRFLFTGGSGKHEITEKLPLVIFSDDKRYWKNFESVCRELDKRGFDVTYMTASPDDPALNNTYEHVHGIFIGKDNKAFYRLNFLNASIVLSTTPNLEVYQWKRSKNVDFYVHILHAANDITMYEMFSVDYYDAVLVSGQYQIDQVRKMEQVRSLPAKELVMVGLPYMDDIALRLSNTPAVHSSNTKTVLLAPSWGRTAIFSRYGGEIIKKLLQTDYHIIVRPHPQTMASEKEMINSIMAEYPASEQLEWNFDNDNFDVLNKADILISDFSGIIFEFALVYDKPVIYTEVHYDKSTYDCWWFPEDELWTFKALPRLGLQLDPESCSNITEMIEECLNDPSFSDNREQLRKETWENIGSGAIAAADYLIAKYEELTARRENQ